MLIGLLAYDVFWVFYSSGVVGENVMLEVATSSQIEGPLKLMLPGGSAASKYPFSILGLGDVVIPGIFAALMLRFDAFQKLLQRQARTEPKMSEGKDDAGLCYSMESVVLNPPQETTVSEAESLSEDKALMSSLLPILEPREELLSSRKYIVPVFGSYAAGLMIAFGANVITGAGQPALLYIVPCMLTTTVVLASARGELWDRLLPYNEKAEPHQQ